MTGAENERFPIPRASPILWITLANSLVALALGIVAGDSRGENSGYFAFLGCIVGQSGLVGAFAALASVEFAERVLVAFAFLGSLFAILYVIMGPLGAALLGALFIVPPFLVALGLFGIARWRQPGLRIDRVGDVSEMASARFSLVHFLAWTAGAAVMTAGLRALSELPEPTFFLPPFLVLFGSFAAFFLACVFAALASRRPWQSTLIVVLATIPFALLFAWTFPDTKFSDEAVPSLFLFGAITLSVAASLLALRAAGFRLVERRVAGTAQAVAAIAEKQ